MKILKNLLQSLLTLLFLITTIYAEQYSKSFYSTDYSLKPLENGTYQITMNNFGKLTQKGYPELPSKTVFISLPKGANVENIDITTEPTLLIPGSYIIKSTDILFPLSSNDNRISEIVTDHQNKKQLIYSKNKYYPESTTEILNVDYFDNKPVIKVRYTPIIYNPVKKSLKIVKKIMVTVDYSMASDLLQPSFKNTDQEENDITTTTSLLIISSETLKDEVENFMFWKKCLGIKTEYVSFEWIEDNFDGKDKAEKTRKFLKNKNTSDKTKNILFIGDRTISPIRYFYPDPNNHSYTGCIVSDLYFSDLTCDWDSDGDNHLGEFEQDKIEWLPEVNIGRIPWNDPVTVRNILNRIIEYEKNNGLWKNNSLLMGSITNFKNEDFKGYPLRTDGAYLMEALKNNVFANNVSTTLYEQDGIQPSDFESDFPLNNQNINTNWLTGEYGCLTWWSHGGTESAQRKWWQADDGDNVPESGEIRQKAFLHIYNIPNSSDNHPIIFANSCHIGAFCETGLGRKIIKDESTGIIAASSASWSTVGWNDINAGGSSTLSYYFWEECIKNKKSIGEALKAAKIRYLKNFNDSWYHLNNVYTFNYFGDPTLKTTNVEPLYGAISGKLIPNIDTTSVTDIEIMITELGRKTITDKDGKYLFYYVPEGEYHITAFSNKYEKDKTTYVKKGEIATADLNPIPFTHSLTALDSTCSVILQEGENNTSSVMIKNDGNDIIEYRINYNKENSFWLTIDPDLTHYTIRPHTLDTLLLQITTYNLDQGKYESTVNIHKDTSQIPLITIPVNITVIDTIPPAPINNLNFTKMEESDSIKLAWTAPGDNGLNGTADKYDIILSNKPFQLSGSQNIRYLNQISTPHSAKSLEQYAISKNDYKEYPYIIIRTWDEVGLYSLSNEILISITDVDLNNGRVNIPNDYAQQNYPNPFNLETTIEFGLSQSSNVDIMIYNERGQLIKHLVKNKFMNSGKHQVVWDATTSYNNVVPSGLYLYKITTDEHVFVKKMTLLK